jgi:hypothetical protein
MALAIAGCATIVGDKVHLMPITSTPSDAQVVITDERGVEVFKGTTPTTVTLQKSTGEYWGKKSYSVKISKPGFEPQLIPVMASPNIWYIGGNIIFGGLIGWFIVDPFNGGMYSLSPDTVASTLGRTAESDKPTTSHNNSATDGSITIMLLQDVPAELRSKMKRIN